MHSESLRRFLDSDFTKFSYQTENSKIQVFSDATYHVVKRW